MAGVSRAAGLIENGSNVAHTSVLMAPVARQLVIHRPSTTQKWRQSRQTVRPKCVKADRQQQQQQEAGQRDLQGLPRAYQPQGQLNNALPKAKRRALNDSSAPLPTLVQEDDMTADQQRIAVVPAFTEPADARGIGEAAAQGSGRHAASGTVVGAIALITGMPSRSHQCDGLPCRKRGCYLPAH